MPPHGYTFIPSSLDGVEDAEDYQPGGFHPIAIGDSFSQSRYRVVHKLGYGGSSTVWLARDTCDGDRLVALKAMRADASPKHTDEILSLSIAELLRAVPPLSSHILPVDDHFFVQGPNGTHMFLVSPFAGPNLLAMSDCPGRVIGSRRLRADLARKVAKQTAMALYYMHSAGIVHGDLTTSNILFRLSPQVRTWSDAELYRHLGRPQTEELRTWDGTPRPSGAPAERVAPIDNPRWTDASILQESIALGDFGQSYVVASPPPDYEPATVFNYISPEARFEDRAGLEADVWALGCAIFEIRAGAALFETFLQSDLSVLIETVSLLGRLPDPWWGMFTERSTWFGEDGEAKSAEEQERAGGLRARKTSIREQLRLIGAGVDAPLSSDGPMIEQTGVRLREEEVDLLGDLLEKMLKYRPEDRIRIDEVINHPWFNYAG
ncbi:unnamed protein product [Peniophora sp. CBMAI 1063]|nr:unnamed protein product [Peniophora sp. CBMAI 1063]